MKKIIQVKKTKLFWLYFVFAGLMIIASVFLAPVWDGWKDCPWKTWGTNILGYVIAGAVIFYLCYFLIKKLMHSRGTIQILYIIEFVILLLIAVGSILTQLNIIPIKEICMIVGLILWCEGGIDLFRAYFHQRDSKTKYPVWRLCLAIGVVTLGTYMFAAPFFQNIVVLWIFVSFLFLIGVIAIALGVMSKPAKKIKAKAAK